MKLSIKKANFYQAGSPVSPVIVTEGAKAIPVGMVMPVRLTFDAGQYYNDMEGE